MRPYYDDGVIQIFNGDALDIIPGLEMVDATITDPPYAEQTHSGMRSCPKKSSGKPFEKDQPVNVIDFDSITIEELQAFFALSIQKTKAWTIATIDWRFMGALENNPPPGSRFVRFGVWVKPNGAPQFTGDRPAAGWEAVLHLHREGGRMEWNGGGGRAVYTHNIHNSSAYPTQKPLSLLKEFIALYTSPGDTILDFCCGSGTTLRAAKDLGRKAIGIDKKETACEIAARRMGQEVLAL